MIRFILLFIFAAANTQAQFPLPIVDARLAASGNSFCTSDAAIFPADNPAHLTGKNFSLLNFSFKKFTNIQGMNQSSVSMISKFQSFHTGLSWFRLGDENFSQQNLSLGIADKIGHTAVGMRMDLIQLRAAGFNTDYAISLSTGFLSSISAKIRFGAAVQQINNPGLGSGEAKLPPVFTIGFSFIQSEDLQLGISLRKDMLNGPRPTAGLSYQLKPDVFLRMGLQLNPYAWSGGFGFNYWKVSADYAMVYSRFNGIIIQASVRLRPDVRRDKFKVRT